MGRDVLARASGVRIADVLDAADFCRMADLERRFYGEGFITPPQEAQAWYEACPESVVAAKDVRTAQIAGFVNLFPVRRLVGDALLAGEFNDAGLTVADIAGPHDAATMFFCCAVVGEGYRGKGLLRRLVHAAVAPYRRLVGEIPLVVADTVTDDGARLMERYGFGFVRGSDHSSRVYAQPFSEFVDHVDAAMRSFCVRDAPVGRTRRSL